MYALQGGYFVPGGPLLREGSRQILSDGSVPCMEPIYDSNDRRVGGHNEPNGWYRHTRGGVVGEEGRQYFTYANTRAVSYWGLGRHDFISGEQDDYLDGSEGLIWGKCGECRGAIYSGSVGYLWVGAEDEFDQKIGAGVTWLA